MSTRTLTATAMTVAVLVLGWPAPHVAWGQDTIPGVSKMAPLQLLSGIDQGVMIGGSNFVAASTTVSVDGVSLIDVVVVSERCVMGTVISTVLTPGLHTLTAETAGGTASMTFEVLAIPTNTSGFVQYADVAFDQIGEGTALELCNLLNGLRSGLDGSLPAPSGATASLAQGFKKQASSTKSGSFALIGGLQQMLRERLSAFQATEGAAAVEAAKAHVDDAASQAKQRVNGVMDMLMERKTYFVEAAKLAGMKLGSARGKASDILNEVAAQALARIAGRTDVDSEFRSHLMARVADTLDDALFVVTSAEFTPEVLSVSRLTATYADQISHVGEQTRFCVAFGLPPGAAAVPRPRVVNVPPGTWKFTPFTVTYAVTPPPGTTLANLHVTVNADVIRAGANITGTPGAPVIVQVAGGITINAIPPAGVAGDLIIITVTVERWGLFKWRFVETAVRVFRLQGPC